MGYPNDTKGYKVFNIESGKFGKSRNIWFSESQFHDFSSEVKAGEYIVFPEDTVPASDLMHINNNKDLQQPQQQKQQQQQQKQRQLQQQQQPGQQQQHNNSVGAGVN